MGVWWAAEGPILCQCAHISPPPSVLASLPTHPPPSTHQSASIKYLSNTRCPASQLQAGGGAARWGAVSGSTIGSAQHCCHIGLPPPPRPPAPQVAAREEAGDRVARQVVHPALLPQLRHYGINPAGVCGGAGAAPAGWRGRPACGHALPPQQAKPQQASNRAAAGRQQGGSRMAAGRTRGTQCGSPPTP